MTAAVTRAVVLAAGLGTRLRWLTRTQPKALMPLGAEAAIERVIRGLVRRGVRWIAVNAHHHADRLAAVLGDGARLGCAIAISREPALLDSGGGAARALDLLPPGDDPVVIHNADAILDPPPELDRLAAVLPAGGAAALLAPNPPWHAGDLALRGDRASFRAAPGERRWTFTGVSCWDPAALAGMPRDRAWPLAERMRALDGEGRLAGVVHVGRWRDIGRPRDWFAAWREA